MPNIKRINEIIIRAYKMERKKLAGLGAENYLYVKISVS
jgi:hypothetical protein